MKVALLGESPADIAAVRVLVEGLLEDTVDDPALPDGVSPVTGRGWPSVRQVLPGLITSLHYWSDAEGLVVVADTDDSPLHVHGHETGETAAPGCRLCSLRGVVETTKSRLQSRPVGQPLSVAIGVAVPEIEAWYLTGRSPEVGEAAWLQRRRSVHGPHIRRRLKEQVYGTDRPGGDLQQQLAVEQARRLAEDLSLLEEAFPQGFGPLAREVRRWRGG